MDKQIELCNICATVGKQSKLKIYQINLEEAVKLCEDEACNYPIGIDKLVQRKFDEMSLTQRRKTFNRQKSFYPPVFSSNLNQNVPRPQPVFISSQAPGNIFRPQPITAFPSTSTIVPPSPGIEQLVKSTKLDGFSSAIVSGVPNSKSQKSYNVSTSSLSFNQTGFHISQSVVHPSDSVFLPVSSTLKQPEKSSFPSTSKLSSSEQPTIKQLDLNSVQSTSSQSDLNSVQSTPEQLDVKFGKSAVNQLDQNSVKSTSKMLDVKSEHIISKQSDEKNSCSTSQQADGPADQSQLQAANNPFISPDSEMDIDTSEVTEFIDVFFNSDTACLGVTPKSRSPEASFTALLAHENSVVDKIPSPYPTSSDLHPTTPVGQCLENSRVPSSPFIPMRSNLRHETVVPKIQEKHSAIKPMGSNNAADNVISQEFEIETSSNAGSPLLGDKTTYFVIENKGKRRGRPPKLKEEKTKTLEKDDKIVEQEKPNDPLVIEKKVPSLDIYKYFPQWQNEEALCWLDVVLCLFVHSKTIKRIEIDNENIDLSHTILVTLFKAYQQSCQLVNKYREKVFKEHIECASRTRSGRLFSDPEESDSDAMNDSPNTEMMKELCKFSSNQSVKTGAGLSCSKDFLSMLPSGDQENYRKAYTILKDIRENIWKKMEPRLQCVKGKNDSPVLAIPLMVKDSIYCERKFSVEYDFIFTCKVCGYKQTDRFRKVLPTFPSTEIDFTMKDPYCLRFCFKCNADKQQRILKFNKINGALMLHFAEGLPHNNFKKLEFWHAGLKYSVTGFVQYRNDPDHFVTWIRRLKDNKWVEFDDLKSPICRFESKQPEVDSKQIHIVMWESCKSVEVDTSSSHIKEGKRTMVTSNISLSSVHNKQILKELPTVCQNLNLDLKQQPYLHTTLNKESSEKLLISADKTDNLTATILSDTKLSKAGTIPQLPTDAQHSEYEIRHTNVKKSLAMALSKSIKAQKQKNKPQTDVDLNNSSVKKVKTVKLVEQKTVQKVRIDRSEMKKRGQLSPQERSDQIIQNVLKSMSSSNVVLTQKMDLTPSIEDRRQALARLWKPKPEVMTQIRKAENEKKLKSGRVENNWKPVNKVKLTEQKYRGELNQPEVELTSINVVKCGEAETMTNIETQTISSSCSYVKMAAGDPIKKSKIPMNGHSECKTNEQVQFYTTVNKSSSKLSKCLVNGQSKLSINGHSHPISNGHSEPTTNGHSQSISNGHSDPRTNGYLQPKTNGHTELNTNGHTQPIKNVSSRGRRRKYNIHVPFNNESTDKFSNSQLKSDKSENSVLSREQNFKTLLSSSLSDAKNGIGNNNSRSVETHENLSQSRCTSIGGSRFSLPHKTFAGYRQKSFSGFKSASFNQSNEAPSPTLSTKSEFVYPSKRKSSISNFITVKRPKFQISSTFTTPSVSATSSAINSVRCSPVGGVGNKESDILQNLYDALDIPLPDENPDSLDLSAIENSSCLQNMDDFLDQLV